MKSAGNYKIELEKLKSGSGNAEQIKLVSTSLREAVTEYANLRKALREDLSDAQLKELAQVAENTKNKLKELSAVNTDNQNKLIDKYKSENKDKSRN